MKISSVSLKGFRNFKDSIIKFNGDTLIIGANDVGKSNLLHALRLLLDKTLSDSDIEPTELDFYISPCEAMNILEITICFEDIQEDAVLSILKGNVSSEAKTFLRYQAVKNNLSYQILIGPSLENLELINSRFYLKYVNLKYIQSQRDLQRFIQKEKRKLLKLSQSNLTESQREEDTDLLNEIGFDLKEINEKITQLYYVDHATKEVNEELKKLAYHHSEYSVQLDSGAIQVSDFIDNLQLGANVHGSNILLGGDGRNNQILLALWKAKSIAEHDINHEVVFYAVEEPEAHLHPHQQRKLANYLIEELPGQAIISSHSPQIASHFLPDSIIRLLVKNYSTVAASGGCSDCISECWDEMGYRISIIPAESFFSNGVFLVEGPSEVLLYTALAKALEIDLDYYNISILSVDGIAFEVYTNILNALEIPWVMRTDNDVSKVPRKNEWQYAGINRCLRAIGLAEWPHSTISINHIDVINDKRWNSFHASIRDKGVFISNVDLETDLINSLEASILPILDKDNKQDAIKFMQQKKAIRMSNLLKQIKEKLIDLENDNLTEPLKYLKSLIIG
ncbi:AAA family ATPase [Acinetobacter baumannii]|uniref:AAA family ATPase n=3 Tax=Acinetobacter baumannii TaxID=470 RepID=A0A1Y1P1I2_ACIBA|nr:AAA family ATPase [Acinetobacter baumannii]EKX9481214.1 AAA family ATPase [Acinetobacter baumannii]EKY1523809.1 AAA family ATPase [Acinetobacter baumannii]KMV02505.1 AAA ATPase domain protein [Acinetobacter baumannii]MBE2426079.1 AAA family ATPase [Acinetobacter baumannii]MBE2492352.1 AAA family ATPase [Acinetobacter baumannii]